MTFTKKLRELLKGATKGPWGAGYAHWGKYQLYGCYGNGGFNIAEMTAYVQPEFKEADRKNIEFIAFLANHASEIAALVEAAEQLLKEVNYTPGLADNDIRKGSGNKIADALAALEERKG